METLKLGVTQMGCLLLIVAGVLSAGCMAEDISAAEEVRPVAKLEKKTKDGNVKKSEMEAVGAKNADSAEEVRTLAVTPEAYETAIEVSGKALAAKQSMLSLEVPGIVKQILVERGDRVKKGQALLRLDRAGFLLGIRQAEAALVGANAATAQLETEIARIKRLLAEGAAPSASLDDLNAKYKGASAQAQMARVSLQQARKALRDSELRAPYNGVITDVLIEKGEQSTSMPPTILMSIVDASSLEVQVFVPEEEAPFVHVGNQAKVTVDSVGLVTSGKVVFVSDAISPGARTFEVRVRIDNTDGKIKAGAFARVRMEQDKQDNAVLLLVSYVKRDEKDRPYVFVADNGRAKKKMLVLGPMDGARVLVKSGLERGELLIVSDTAGLADGRPVTVEN